jgi:hypothetical protein
LLSNILQIIFSKGFVCLDGYLEIDKNLKEKKHLFVSTVSLVVKTVQRCFVGLVIQILEILVHDVEKQILWKKRKNSLQNNY